MKGAALITGASNGIGRAIALALAERGHPVAINYNSSREAAEELCQKIIASGGNAAAIQADISDPAQVEGLFSAAETALGPVEYLVNNAGVAWTGLFSDMDDSEWSRLRGGDLDGVFYCCRRAIPAMVRRKSGCIVNISSIWGLSGASCEAAYSALKAGVIGLTRALAKELGPSGIRVNAIAPGVINTAMNQNLSPADMLQLKESTPLGRIGSPRDVAGCAAFLCSEEASFITGQVIAIDGGFGL